MVELIIPPHLRARYQRGWDKYVATGKSAVVGKLLEFTALRADGTEFPVEFTVGGANPAGDQRLTAILRDITERKRAEEALRQSETRYRTLVETISDGITEIDVYGRIILANQSLHRMYEYEQGELEGKTIFDLIATDSERQELREYFSVLVSEQPPPVPYFGQIRGKDGTIIETQVNWAYKRDEHGQLIGFTSVNTDITERKQTEEALRKSEQQLNDFFENAAVCLHWVGPDGIILRVNRTELEMLGYAREEYVGHHIAEFHADAEVIQDILNRLTGNETLHDYEARLRCKDGSIRHVLINSNALWEDGRFIHTRCFTRDITESKRAQEQARQREVEMVRVGRLVAMGEMTASIAHELNQPLSAIANFAAACRRNLSSSDGDPSRLPHSLERIEAMTDRAGGVIRRIRGLSQQREHVLSSVDLNELVREMVELVGPEIRLAEISMRFESEEQMPLVQADPVEIQQVILNLLRNAMEAMKDGGSPPHELCVRTSCVKPDEVEITVSDTGPGIPSEVADRLFDPFVTSKPDGLGIGLSISKKIIDGHGGRLWVAPNPGRGSTFYVTLPVDRTSLDADDRYQSEGQTAQ